MFGWLFGGSKTAEKSLDIVDTSIKGIGSWIDNKDFTPEEKAKMHAEAVKTHLKLVEATSQENSVRSVTRRYLAWGITFFILIWSSIGIAFAIAGRYQTVEWIISVVNAFHLGMSFLAVIGFYFGVQLLRK